MLGISAILLVADLCGFAHPVIELLGDINSHLGLISLLQLKVEVKKLKDLK